MHKDYNRPCQTASESFIIAAELSGSFARSRQLNKSLRRVWDSRHVVQSTDARLSISRYRVTDSRTFEGRAFCFLGLSFYKWRK
jgi:hypothetical protein